jgi:hypothetical protein
VSAHGCERGEEHGERLFFAALARAQAPNRRVAPCVAQELEAADPAQCDDRAFREGARCSLERGRAACRLFSVGAKQRELRATVGAGGRLPMKSPIRRIPVLALTALAERKGDERRRVAVVRQIDDDRVARAAARAGSEGIAVTAVARVAELAHTVGARGEIGGQRRRHRARVFAWNDGKAVPRALGQCVAFERIDARGWRRRFQRPHELVELDLRALHLDFHAAASVSYPAVERALGRFAIDERAKADALNGALDFETQACHAPAGARKRATSSVMSSSCTAR